MSNEKQTAVEWQHIELSKFLHGKSEFTDAHDILIKAKEMEKEQKKHAYDWGETNGADECNGDGATHENFEQYYQETYGGGEQ
jgi:hypothetical protein